MVNQTKLNKIADEFKEDNYFEMNSNASSYARMSKSVGSFYNQKVTQNKKVMDICKLIKEGNIPALEKLLIKAEDSASKARGASDLAQTKMNMPGIIKSVISQVKSAL